MNPLDKKTVLITGASSGIGLETARAFGRRGCRVALAARRTEKLTALSEDLKKLDVETLILSCDVRDKEQSKNAVEDVVKAWGNLNILINCAGISDLQSFDHQNLDRIEDVINTNLLGTLYTTHAALPHMRRSKEGHILNVSSVAGLMGIPWMAAYSASKFAVVGFTEALRRELHGSGIRLTAFCPGTVDTAMAETPLQDEALRKSIDPKTAEETAERIVRAILKEIPEDVYGEVSALQLRIMRFFPRLVDWAVHRIFTRKHPQVRELLQAEKADHS